MQIVQNGPGDVALDSADRAAAVMAVKARLNVTIADDDALIAAFAESALGIAEQFTGRVLIARSMTARITAGGGWARLPAEPVRAIGTVALVAGEGATSELAPDLYAVDIDAGGRGWLRTSGAAGSVAVTFTAGQADTWTALPAAIREGVCVLAAHLYRDRDGSAPIPAAVTALWRPFRLTRLAEQVRA